LQATAGMYYIFVALYVSLNLFKFELEGLREEQVLTLWPDGLMSAEAEQEDRGLLREIKTMRRLRSREVRSGGGASFSRPASSRAPSDPRPRPPMRSTTLVPLAPTPLTSSIRPRDDTCNRPHQAATGVIICCSRRAPIPDPKQYPRPPPTRIRRRAYSRQSQ
jgi:hypothetical protein